MKSRQTKSNPLLDAALAYRRRGFSVIPVGRNKKPLLKWEGYQRKHPTGDEIRSWWTKWPKANVAIVTGKISKVMVFDQDTQEAREKLNEIFPDSFVCPMARSPRGGNHLYCQHDEGITTGVGVLPGCDIRADGGYIIAPPSRGPNGKNYEWLPGLSINDIAPPPHCLVLIKNNKSTSTIYKGSSPSPPDAQVSLGKGHRDASLFHVANCLVKGGMAKNNIEYVLEILARKCQPPFPEKEVQAKIKSAIERAERLERTLAQEIRDWISVTDGYFNVTSTYQALQIVTSKEKANARVIFHRLVKEGLLERHGKQDGCYRLIDFECEEIDWRNANIEEFQLILPFELHKLVEIHQKNIIVVAGEMNAGKTAWLLNTAKDNMDRHEIWFFSSEMGSRELRKRLMLFSDVSFPHGWNIKTYERSANFADVIEPDALNMVDFLEVHDDFWRVGGMLKAIHDKLREGIAIVAVQKDPNKFYGRGASMGLEKPRLYLTISEDPPGPNTVKIVKAKNFRDGVENPNGKQLDFKLVKGSNFIPVTEWRRVSKRFPLKSSRGHFKR